jgi:hypothetical protein
MRLEGVSQLKNPMTSLGIEPAAFFLACKMVPLIVPYNMIELNMKSIDFNSSLLSRYVRCLKAKHVVFKSGKVNTNEVTNDNIPLAQVNNYQNIETISVTGHVLTRST